MNTSSDTIFVKATTTMDGYFRDVDIYDYDETIVAHPYMDQIKSAIAARVIKHESCIARTVRVADVGTGSGQLARTLLGLQNSKIALFDIDLRSKDFCSEHPELADLPFHVIDFADPEAIESFAGGFDVACVLGTLHHIPPTQRKAFLKNLARVAGVVLLADEGILEYESEIERRRNAEVWYDFVINEAKRRGLRKLAALERLFKASDISSVRGPHDDFKQSPTEIRNQIKELGFELRFETRIGDWKKNRGGMYLIEYSQSSY